MAKKIVLIDDDPVFLNMVTYRLQAKGYEVFSASDGQEGVVLVKSMKPDLIILDFRLPSLQGHEVSHQLFGSDLVKGIPILLVTASVDNIAEKARLCGAVDYLAKPVSFDTLCDKVSRCLGHEWSPGGV